MQLDQAVNDQPAARRQVSAYVVSRTVEVSASGRRTVHTTAEAPTMNEVLTMHQVVRMQDAGIESTIALAAIADGDDAQA